MKQSFRRFTSHFQTFFQSVRAQEGFVFLFFLLVAAGFWLMVRLNDTFAVELSVPLQLTEVPEGVHITTELPEQVSVSVRDKGTMLVRFVSSRSLRPVTLDFRNYDNGAVSGRVQIPQNDVLRAVQSQLESTTHIEGLRPDTLEFYYNRGLRHRLPVRVVGTFTTSPQNYLQGVSVVPDSVDVYAPASVRDTMTAAFTQALSQMGLTQDAVFETRLMPIRGVKYEPSRVTVSASVDYYTEKSVQVPIIGLNFPAERRLRTFPAQATITFRVGAARYQEFTADNFVLAFTYEELLRNESEKLHLHLKSLPEGVANVRIAPQEVDYLIEERTAEGDGSEE